MQIGGVCFVFFFQAEDGIRDAQESRGLGDVYKRQVYVEGRLSTEQWTDKATGANRSKVVVLCDRVQSLTWDTLAQDAKPESKLDAMAQDAPAADEDIPF